MNWRNTTLYFRLNLLRSSVLRPSACTMSSILASQWRGFRGERFMSSVKINIIPAPPPSKQSYKEKNSMLNRELSPHLSVYKPQLTSFLSIMLRISGIALCWYMWIASAGYLLAQKKVDELITDAQDARLDNLLWIGLRFVIALPFSFHMVNGFRHLAFFCGGFLQIEKVYVTGYVVLVLSIILAICLALVRETCEYINGDK